MLLRNKTPLTQQEVNAIKPHIKGLACHWSAGTYYTLWDHYHFCIQYDPKTDKAKVVQTLSLEKVGAHLLSRNTGYIGVSLCAMANGFPVKKPQIETMAKLLAELCFVLDVDPDGVHTAPKKKFDGRRCNPIPGTIEVPNVTDHNFFAHADGYKDYRWDIGELMPVVYKKCQWYYSKIDKKKPELEFLNIVR